MPPVPPMTLREMLEHIESCPDGCGVCRELARRALSLLDGDKYETEIERLQKLISDVAVHVRPGDLPPALFYRLTAQAITPEKD